MKRSNEYLGKKRQQNNYEGKTILIRNMEASLLYMMGVEKYPEFKENIENYVELCNQKNTAKKELKEIKDDAKKEKHITQDIKDKISSKSNELTTIETKIKEYSCNSNIFKLDKNRNFELKGKDNRYYYRGNLPDSLMRRKLASILEKKDEFSMGNTCGFCDVIINISFSKDYMFQDSVSKNGTFFRKVINRNKLRDIFYRDGVWINGVHYVQFERSSSKARTGDCLFIDEKYLPEMLLWVRMGLNFKKEIIGKNGKPYKKPKYIKVDITGSRSYESLTSSSIICTVNIDPYSILLIDDVSSFYTMESNVIESEEFTYIMPDNHGESKEKTESRLIISPKDYTQTTDLWDGQSLIDESVFRTSYKTYNKNGRPIIHTLENKGFILLRNHFLKSAGFNTKLQKWYQSEETKKHLIYQDGLYYAKDRFGNLMETSTIKMVTTKNSIKIFKEPFMSCILYDKLRLSEDEVSKKSKLERETLVWDWYRAEVKRLQGTEMGVCKYEKTSKFVEGLYQQLAYQMLNSLNFTKDELKQLSMEQINEIMLSKNHVAFFKNMLDTRKNSSAKQSMILALLDVNDKVQYTQIYKDYKDEQLKRLRERIEHGKIFTENSDYCVLFGNPYEMLLASAGMLEVDENGQALNSIMDNPEHDRKKQFECYSPKFRTFDENGNDIEKELFGFRSPHICEANAALFVNTYHPEYEWFNMTDNIIAVSFFGYGAFLSPKLNGADVDSDTCLVGDNEIVLRKVREAQRQLLPINGISPKAKMLPFTDANLSDTDSRLANDYIGRICNLAQNLQSYYWHIYNSGSQEQKDKYLQQIYDDICLLEVLSNIAIDSAKREYPVNIEKEIRNINSRPYLSEKGAIIEGDSIIFEETIGNRTKKYMKKPRFMRRNRKSVLKKYNKEVCEIYNKIPKEDRGNEEKVKEFFMQQEDGERFYNDKKRVDDLRDREKKLVEKMYLPFDTPMDMVRQVLDENIKKGKSTPTIPITMILNDIPSGQKADFHRVKNIINSTVEYGKELCSIEARYRKNEIIGEQMYKEKMAVEQKAIEEYSKIAITQNDVITLIRKVYDIRDRYDTNGKLVEKNGIDKRDKSLLESKMGSRMLQWIYKAHENVFLSAIQSSVGKISTVKEVTDMEMLPDKEIFVLYGKSYIINVA